MFKPKQSWMWHPFRALDVHVYSSTHYTSKAPREKCWGIREIILATLFYVLVRFNPQQLNRLLARSLGRSRLGEHDENSPLRNICTYYRPITHAHAFMASPDSSTEYVLESPTNVLLCLVTVYQWPCLTGRLWDARCRYGLDRTKRRMKFTYGSNPTLNLIGKARDIYWTRACVG